MAECHCESFARAGLNVKDTAGSRPAPRQTLPCWFKEGKWQKPSWIQGLSSSHEAYCLLSICSPFYPFLIILSILNKLHLVFYLTLPFLKGWLSANPVPLTGHTCSLCFSTADKLAQEKWWELWPRWVPLLYSHLQNSLLLAPWSLNLESI